MYRYSVVCFLWNLWISAAASVNSVEALTNVQARLDVGERWERKPAAQPAAQQKMKLLRSDTGAPVQRPPVVGKASPAPASKKGATQEKIVGAQKKKSVAADRMVEKVHGHSRAGDPSVVAVIAETRKLVALPVVVMNLHRQLPDVPIQFFYGERNQDFAQSEPSLMELRKAGVLTLTPLPGEHFKGDLNWKNYELLMESKDFWFATTWAKQILIFQSDTWVCPGAAQLLQSFIKYDYVGAPWDKSIATSNAHQSDCNAVGNGGFSLRSRDAMIQVTKMNPPNRSNPAPEDVYFCSKVAAVPDAHTASQFAHESTFDGQPSVGVHKPWDRAFDLNKLDKICHGVKTMKSLQSKVERSTDYRTSEEAIKTWARGPT